AGEENASQLIEAFRELRITLGFAYGSAGPMTLVVTSPSQSEGKTLITTNLAVAFAEMGRRTLLIDADTRRGDAHRLLGLERTPGLTDYLRDRSSGEVIQFTKYDHLHFIGSGTRSSTTPELLASQRMGQFFGTLKRAYDVILIDSPPLAAGGDAVLLSALAGNMAIVIRSGSTEKPLTLAKLEGLSRLPIRVLGAILNDVSASGSSYGYYSSSYLPGYEASDEPDIETAAGQPRLLADAGVDEAGGQAS
ncbi:MAG TPA: CpsD/CapB family tyrosine-protein kinase, partial [Longimicrobiales bacterium]|nr:CpsD/CapB family tyrosine-protein kinase [Longimicrobiales bacterium]